MIDQIAFNSRDSEKEKHRLHVNVAIPSRLSKPYVENVLIEYLHFFLSQFE